ncbi:uncharacterized protein LOC119412592 [Nematolebias whitei]|uniref:uncharacterized protein LOC119412592 n=1 Tax=Nematolebias whitei TaxID=451745 RepID=UPI001897B15F|nr:uncharacterized protein LOC119412592 [Nematolebias whitei]
MRIITESEEKLQIEIKVDAETKENEAETLEVKKTGADEPEEVKCSAEDGGRNATAAQVLSAEPPNSPTPTGDDFIQPRESTQPPETQQMTAETPVDEPPQVQPSPMPSPDSTAQKPEADAKTGDGSGEAALESVQSNGNLESETHLKDSATAETRNSPVLEPVDGVTAAGTPNTKPGTTATETAPSHTPAALTTLTFGERIQWYCQPYKFDCISAKSIVSSQPLRFDSVLLLITNLPMASVKYTETDMASLLSTFGFKYEHDNIYVIPQRQMIEK